MTPQKIIVTGATGQLGMELQQLASSFPSFEFFFLGREDLDIVQKDAVDKKMTEMKPHYLINCAAYTAVDKAEADQANAFAVNSDAAFNLATACAQHGVQFIHISTDYVFDGSSTQPYKEDDAVSPSNVYGQSKQKGEEEVLKNNKEAIIIRTAWVYSAFGNNFVKTMLRLMKSKPEIGVVDDQYGSPTYAADFAEAIMQIIQSGKRVPGIYHFSNEGIITWFDFASEIKNISGSSCTVNAITTEQYPTPAKRPKYSVFDKTKIQNTFGIKMKDWKESLVQCLQKLPE